MKPLTLKRETHPTGPRRISDSHDYMRPQYEQDLGQHIRDGRVRNKRLREIQYFVASCQGDDPRHPDTGGNLETRQ